MKAWPLSCPEVSGNSLRRFRRGSGAGSLGLGRALAAKNRREGSQDLGDRERVCEYRGGLVERDVMLPRVHACLADFPFERVAGLRIRMARREHTPVNLPTTDRGAVLDLPVCSTGGGVATKTRQGWSGLKAP